jgi:hypothetical protein
MVGMLTIAAFTSFKGFGLILAARGSSPAITTL